MQLDIEDKVAGFEIQRCPEGFRLVDRATFNNWGEPARRFDTRDAAADYAQRCDDFKRGRRMTV